MLFLILSFLACSVEQNLLQDAIRCRTTLEEILQIQNQRNTMMDQMQANSLAFQRGEMNKDEHLAHFTSWRSQESELHKQADQLLDTAEAIGCL